MEDKIFKTDAKQIVDLMFDNKLFKDNVTRDDMNVFEDLITFLLQSRFESYQRVNALLERVKETEYTKSNKEK